MITVETTSEKISAWLRNEGRCAKGLSSQTMSCAIFASTAPRSKASFGAKSSADGTNRGAPRPRAPATRHLCQRTGDGGVESFVQGRAVKSYLCSIAPYLGARVAKASVWKFTPSRRIFLKTGYVVAHRPPSQRQSVLHARGNTLVLPGQPRRNT